ncbi:MalY/PatB family protein [Geotoga petraea]|jgi:cystathionine beta-lyase|uniref:cysteine-S-conjugate beta-lyase n=1 Tax=Geotoga petraea TaxID=28234 RepID=A0A1G6JUB1_9BACT|nr:MalY/PatB family protein [Geotoga petraea]MDK2945645.1 cysteine-S-conjugate beta-lyase [Geotoga sp.]SDC21995.1 cystathione beta-lyase [Geotoga petraea]
MVNIFENIVNRKNTNSVKWDLNETIFGKSDVIPMWVADMDFKAPEEVLNALKEVVDHGVFGYPTRTDSYYNAIIRWFGIYHEWKIEKNWISFSPGVVPGLKIAINALTNPGDKILIQTPVYYPFYEVIKNNERKIVKNEMIYTDSGYIMDFEDLEDKFKDDKMKLFILCSPHNPVGRVWKKEELKKIADLAEKYGKIVISDEIHADLVYKGFKHIPFQKISEYVKNNTITFTAPSKTFNIAGLETANAIIPNKELKELFEKTKTRYSSDLTNIFGIRGLEAAYNYGRDWLDELIWYLEENIDFIDEYFKSNIPQIKFFKPEGTYLLWLDMRELGDEETVKDILINKAGVGLEEGSIFGEGGKGFFRMNIATTRKIIEKALNNMNEAFNN